MILGFAPCHAPILARAQPAPHPVPPFMNCPHSVDSDWPWQCGRSIAALRATATRAIVEGLFGANHIPERTWKIHDLRNRTIRLVQSGFALMRGGCREPRRQSRRKK
jgi:hypothetical protein